MSDGRYLGHRSGIDMRVGAEFLKVWERDSSSCDMETQTPKWAFRFVTICSLD